MGIPLADGDVSGRALTEQEVYDLGLLDEDWSGAGLGLGIGDWTALGAVERVPGSEIHSDFELAREAASRVPAPQQPIAVPASGEFMVIDAVAGNAYHVAMDPADVGVLGRALAAHEEATRQQPATAYHSDQRQGAAGPAQPDVAARPDVQYGPTRSLLPDGAFMDFPWNAMGVANCTGTMIGDTTLVTAAHCIVDQGEGNHQRYYTGTDGWKIAINAGQAALNRCYFETAVDKAFVPAEFVEPGRPQYWYHGYDYAVVALVGQPSLTDPAPPGCPTHPPAMPKGVLSDTVLRNNPFRHDGYPSPSPNGRPNSHYEVLPCDVDNDPQTMVTEDGFDATMATNAIVSDGHSGGPFWYFDRRGQPTVIGTQVGGENSGNMTGVFRRFTPTSLNQINSWVCMAVPCI